MVVSIKKNNVSLPTIIYMMHVHTAIFLIMHLFLSNQFSVMPFCMHSMHDRYKSIPQKANSMLGGLGACPSGNHPEIESDSILVYC